MAALMPAVVSNCAVHPAGVAPEQPHGGVHVRDLRQVEAVDGQDGGRHHTRQVVQLRTTEQQLQGQQAAKSSGFKSI